MVGETETTEAVSPHKTLTGKFSRLAGKSLAGPGKVSNDLKIVV
jgi:hypothetical protein